MYIVLWNKGLISHTGVAAAKDHDIGTTNLHVEASDVVNILVYVGIAKGNGVLSKAGKLKEQPLLLLRLQG